MASCWSQVSVTRAGIDVDGNPLRSGMRKRTKESAAAARHLYLDLDTGGEARLTGLGATDALPTPITCISTLPGRYTDLWRVDGFPIEPQGSALKLLAIAIGNDPTCTDCNLVLWLPGFPNCKFDPACPVTIEYPNDSSWNLDAFGPDIAASNAMLLPCAIQSQKRSGKHTNSERDWALGVRELAHGKDAEKLTRMLVSRRAEARSSFTTHSGQSMLKSAKRQRVEVVPVDDAGSSPVLRDSRSTLFRSCARNCAY
jgi:hypothetical protein